MYTKKGRNRRVSLARRWSDVFQSVVRGRREGKKPEQDQVEPEPERGLGWKRQARHDL